MEEFLKIGVIVKPQGVRGELKVQPLTDDIRRFINLKQVIIDGKPVKVLSSRLGAREIFITLSGVSDRNVAETLRNKFLCVSREDAVKLPENTYFISDIIGCKLTFEGKEPFAEVVDVTEAKTDYFTAKLTNGEIIRFPFLKDILIKVDIKNSLIILNEKRFNEVCVYEN
jgi:16S rRNA processing protein RimM